MKNEELTELVCRVREGDGKAFSTFMALFEKLISCYSWRVDGEDTRQELIVFLLELLQTLDVRRFPPDGTDGLQRYLAVSLRNHYIYLSKKKQRILEEADKHINTVAAEWLPEESLLLQGALSALSEKQRRILIYRSVCGYSDQEIAEQLFISRQAVNRLYRRALTAVQKYYEE